MNSQMVPGWSRCAPPDAAWHLLRCRRERASQLGLWPDVAVTHFQVSRRGLGSSAWAHVSHPDDLTCLRQQHRLSGRTEQGQSMHDWGVVCAASDFFGMAAMQTKPIPVRCSGGHASTPTPWHSTCRACRSQGKAEVPPCRGMRVNTRFRDTCSARQAHLPDRTGGRPCGRGLAGPCRRLAARSGPQPHSPHMPGHPASKVHPAHHGCCRHIGCLRRHVNTGILTLRDLQAPGRDSVIPATTGKPSWQEVARERLVTSKHLPYD
jgi:hypothetical protein